MIDAFTEGRIDALHLLYTRFINTMKQEAFLEPLLPLDDKLLGEGENRRGPWDYIYEPEAKGVVDSVLVRYVEALIYQAIVENFASEQSARMVAMKAASDNAATIIDELQLIYNKARQAAITKEISEIVGGAAAIAS
jgi:F-type H+-transporting ATPase subunit gamma